MPVDTDISRIENKVKMSLLQAEKRLVELEMAVTELKDFREKMKNVDLSGLETLKELPEMKQRFDDLEDLIMAENLGIREMKQMLDEIKTKIPFVEQASESQKQLEGKMSAIGDIQQKISELETLKNEIKNLDDVFRGLSEELVKIKTETTSKPAADFQFLLTKVDGLKKFVDDLNSQKTAVNVRLDGMERSLSLLQTKRTFSPSDDLIKSVENYKNDFANITGRIESMESAARSISENILSLESKVGKFEGFERASAIGKELEMKLGEFKNTEDEIRNLSDSIKSVYANVDLRIDRMKGVEAKFPEIVESVKRLTKEIDRNRIEAIGKATKEDVEKMIQNMENRLGSVQKLPPDVTAKMEMLQRKIDENKIMLSERPRKDEVFELFKNQSGMERIADIERRLMRMERGETETGARTSLRDQLSEPLSAISTQIQTLLDRLVFLESRIGSLERIVQQESAVHPMILE